MMIPLQRRRPGRRRQRTLGSSSRLVVASTTMLVKYSASSLARLGMSANASGSVEIVPNVDDPGVTHGLQWPLITEEEQEGQMQRWIGTVDFSEHALSDSASDSARRQYTDQHPEQPLLAFVLNETNQWLREISQRNAEAESDKFVMMASMNLVNCIAGAHVLSTAHPTLSSPDSTPAGC